MVAMLMGTPRTLNLDDPDSAFQAYIRMKEAEHRKNIARLFPQEQQPQVNPHHALARSLREIAIGQLLRSLYEVTEKKRHEDHYGQW